MVFGAIKRAFGGDYNAKEIEKVTPIIEEVNDLEPEISKLSDDQLAAKTTEFRQRLSDGETLGDIAAEAFAVVREASKRRTGMRQFDVQVLGGMVLHQGKVTEMRTGEGKTLVATMPMYLNALEGKGAHLITVNDYLAKRDAQWMGQIYHSLGLSVGILQHDTSYLLDPEANINDATLRYLVPATRQDVYKADITYGTNNEFGFDYLRDNMATEIDRQVQRPDTPNHFAIVDEVDSILIDEARTPLIISGPAEETGDIYRTFAKIVPRLEPEKDYTVDLKHKSASLTDSGADKVENALGINNIYDPAHSRLTRFLDAALRAAALFHRDQQYVVKDGEVIIVDEFTGRLMTGRRWSDGLHQAVEAKEGIKVQQESVTYATITLQNYFRLYEKLAGMTGTAWTEREELHQIYDLDVLVIPTNREMIRDDATDVIYGGLEGKFSAVVAEVEEAHAQGRPVLVGTVVIETSEIISDGMKRYATCRFDNCGDYHQVCPLKEPDVLNAKQHEREAVIIAQAGVLGAVTIATNMAGRGTDIVLGGNPERMADEIARKRGLDLPHLPEDQAEAIRQEARDAWIGEHDKVIEAGGLHIVGTERHESRRIDNQLRGRAGRQGDPGSSRFFVSFEDDVMRRFMPDRAKSLLSAMGMDEDTPLESGMVSKAIEGAQEKVEGHNFDIRKHVVQYDDVMNRQRDLVYTERRKIIGGADLKDNILGEMIPSEIERAFDAFAPAEDTTMWDIPSLIAELKTIFPLPTTFTENHVGEISAEDLIEEVIEIANTAYEEKEEQLTPERMRTLERLLLLRTLDRLWVYHLTALDEMRQGIGLAGYGGRDPLVEFKREAHDMYEQLTGHIRQQIVRQIFNVTLTSQPVRSQAPRNVQESGPAKEGAAVGSGAATAVAAAGTATATNVGVGKKVGRNDPCPCGSGKKYKKCHGGASPV